MQTLKAKLAFIFILGVSLLCFNGCGGWGASSAPRSASLPKAAPLVGRNDEAAQKVVRFLEDRVRRDPEDFTAHNKLASYYLQRQRETGSVEYLQLAFRAARASLAVIPAERNTGGLAALAQAELTAHEFAKARDHALRLKDLDPDKSYPYQLLGDALLELGEYSKAANAFRQMERFSGGRTVNTETRRARLAILHGETSEAERRLSSALMLALGLPVPPREVVAWCRWQLGETALAHGDYETAEGHYGDALTTYPDYFNAHASMARVRAARGDLQGAIKDYEHAIAHFPDPSFVAALGDLYQLAGQERNAAKQYALVEQIGRFNRVNSELYNRQLALFYADHDLKAEEAYASAVKEYEVRRDIYGADALAWTALKVGKLAEAQAGIKEALRLGTQDAKLFYHAGMIARGAGDEAAARDYLQRALTLNPRFDPLQASIAERIVNQLKNRVP